MVGRPRPHSRKTSQICHLSLGVFSRVGWGMIAFWSQQTSCVDSIPISELLRCHSSVFGDSFFRIFSKGKGYELLRRKDWVEQVAWNVGPWITYSSLLLAIRHERIRQKIAITNVQLSFFACGPQFNVAPHVCSLCSEPPQIDPRSKFSSC